MNCLLDGPSLLKIEYLSINQCQVTAMAEGNLFEKFYFDNMTRITVLRTSSYFQMTYDRDLGGKMPEGPKHGKIDATGAPHVGGNTWAGGTGKKLTRTEQSLLLFDIISVFGHFWSTPHEFQ